MKISNSFINPKQNSNNINQTYEYRSTPQKDMFRLSFMDTKSNKKVEINIDSELLGKLYTRFKEDTDISGNNVNPKGKLKNYLETMWQKFHYERNFKDIDKDGYLNVKELMSSKSGVSFQSLADEPINNQVKWISENETLEKLGFSNTIKQKITNDIQEEIEKNKKFFTLEGFFLGYIEQDKNFDKKVTNDEIISNMKRDLGEEVTSILLAQNSQKIDFQGSILKAIIEWIKRKKEEAQNNLVPLPQQKDIKELQKTLQNMSDKDRVEFEQDPLAFILKRFGIDENKNIYKERKVEIDKTI